MDPEIKQKLDALEQKLDAIYVSSEKTRKYFLWTMYITVALFVLPLIGLIFVIPAFLTNYVGSIQNLGV
jgi:uncharacterized membrane protein YjjP (DUF1212 family)